MKMFKFKAFLATALVAVSMIAFALLLGTTDASAAGVAGVGISAASAGLPLGVPMFSPPDADTGGGAGENHEVESGLAGDEIPPITQAELDAVKNALADEKNARLDEKNARLDAETKITAVEDEAKTALEAAANKIAELQKQIDEMPQEGEPVVKYEAAQMPSAAEIADAVSCDAILLLEAAWTAANSDRYRRNNYVQNLAIAYAQSERAMKDHQARLDQRDADRKQRSEDAAEAMKDDGKDAA